MTQYTHDTAATQYVDTGGTRFAYRRFGITGRPPLVFFQRSEERRVGKEC